MKRGQKVQISSSWYPLLDPVVWKCKRAVHHWQHMKNKVPNVQAPSQYSPCRDRFWDAHRSVRTGKYLPLYGEATDSRKVQQAEIAPKVVQPSVQGLLSTASELRADGATAISQAPSRRAAPGCKKTARDWIKNEAKPSWPSSSNKRVQPLITINVNCTTCN